MMQFLGKHRSILLIAIAFFWSTLTLADITYTHTIEGLIGNPLKNAESRLEQQRKTYPEKLTASKAEHLYLDAEEEIKEATKPFGYFNAEVASNLKKTRNEWHATYTVTPGPLTILSHVSLTIHGPGKNIPELRKLVADFPLKKGDTFTTESYENAKQTLLFEAINHGYIDAKIDKNNLVIDIRDNSAQVTLSLDTKKRHYFGITSFDDATFDAGFLRRFAPYKVGDPFSRLQVAQFQENLSTSEYFAHVAAEPEDPTSTIIPVDVTLKLRKPRQYTYGVGFDTDAGPSVMFGVKFNQLTRDGHTLNSRIKLAMGEQEISTEYLIPGYDPLAKHTVIGVDLNSALEQNTGDSRTIKLHTHYIGQHESWHSSVGLNVLLERSNPSDAHAYNSSLLYPDGSWTWMFKDVDILNIKNGRMRLNVAASTESIVSSMSFAQWELSSNILHQLLDRTRLLVRAKLGVTVSKDFNKMPLSMKFATGGARTVRGYSYNDIGPGKILRTLSGELQQNITGNWYLIGFVDAGMADNAFRSAMYKGIGTGILYNTPLGDAKLSIAKAMDKNGKPIAIQFSIDN